MTSEPQSPRYKRYDKTTHVRDTICSSISPAIFWAFYWIKHHFFRLKDDVKQALEVAGRNDKALMNQRRLQEVKIFTPAQN